MDLGSGSADFVNGSDGHIRLLPLIAAGLAAEPAQMRVNIVIINIFTAAVTEIPMDSQNPSKEYFRSSFVRMLIVAIFCLQNACFIHAI
jgi:hypothetical protein